MAVDNWLPKPIDGKETGKMEAPLKAVNIRDTLNHYGGKVSNKTTSFFKPEANINRWSKHKPIVTRYNADKSRFVSFDDEVWSTQAGSVPKIRIENTEACLIAVWNGCSEYDWFQYSLPTGGELEPFRMGDFRGYRADATSPFAAFSNTDAIDPVNGNVSFQLYIRFYLNDELADDAGGMMSLFDLNEFDREKTYYMVVIDKYTNYLGATTYTPYQGNSTDEAEWGTLTSSFTLGKITNFTEGIHEFAVALSDGVDYYYPLPFAHISLLAEIYYANDYIGDLSGEAYYTEWVDETTGELKTNGHIIVSQTIHAGNETTDGPEFSGQLYAGGTASFLQGPLMYSSVTIEKGETGIRKFNWLAEDYPNTWASYSGILRDAIANGTNVIYVSSSSTGGVEIPVSGSVIQN